MRKGLRTWGLNYFFKLALNCSRTFIYVVKLGGNQIVVEHKGGGSWDFVLISSWEQDGQSRIHIKGVAAVRASGIADFESSRVFDMNRRSKIESFVVVASPRLPLSQREAQTLSPLSSKLPSTILSCPAQRNISCRPDPPN